MGGHAGGSHVGQTFPGKGAMMNRVDSEKGAQRSLLVTLSLYRQEPQALEEQTLSVPCYVMAASGKLTPDSWSRSPSCSPFGAPRFCSHSLGIMGREAREEDVS